MSQELQAKLNSLKNSDKLNLQDEYVGEQGAQILADFLRQHNNLRVLQMKGNDIQAQGVQQIFHALQPLPNLQSVTFEWNNLGIERESINAISGFLLGNQSVQHIGLSNNKIQGKDIDQFVNAVNASNILSVDLKWNSLGTQGGQKLNKMLEQNKKLIYLQTNGNNIAEDVIDQIEQKILINRKNNNIELAKIMGTDDPEDLVGGQTGPLPSFSQQPHTGLEKTSGVNKIHHLENILQQEKLYTQQIKQKLEVELDSLQRKDASNQRTYNELEQKIGDVSNQNKMMVFDIDRLKNEFSLLEKSNKSQSKTHEDRISKNKNLIYEMEKKHKLNCEQLLQDYNHRTKDLSRDWENRCRVIEERIKVLEMEKLNQNDQLKKVEEKQIDLKIKQEQELQTLSRKIQEDILQKYQANLQSLQNKIQALEESHDIHLKRNGELIQEYEKRQQEAQTELTQYQQELQRLEDENETFIRNNNNFKVNNEKLKSDLQIKENNVQQLESEINSLNQQIENKKHYGKQNLENVKVDNQKERRMWEDQREEQILAIQDLENKLKEMHLDNSRLRQEYMKLSQIVQNNVNKEIFSTFKNNNYY